MAAAPATPLVYSYSRFSDERQAAGASLERQANYAEQYAEANGLKLDAALSMRDEGLSAFHQKHIRTGALGVFMKLVVAGSIPAGSVLIVEAMDRLSRAKPTVAFAQMTTIINAGITIVTARDGKAYSEASIDKNGFDLMQSLMAMILANQESEQKSTRVRDAIRRQCEAWVSGKSRGLVRVGNTPGWLRAVDGKWELIPERAKAVELVIDLFRRGMGAAFIANTLHEKGLAVSNGRPATVQITRMLTQPALHGQKVVELPGETFVLDGYYPPLLTREEFVELQDLASGRTRKYFAGAIPALFSGMRLLTCGYCDVAMKSQTMQNKTKPDGTLADGHRRLQCSNANVGGGCDVRGSCSVGPIERAVMNHCSDMMNLRRLYGGDRSSLLESALAAAQARLRKIEMQISRITEALLDSDGPIAAFSRRARELEAEKEEAVQKVADAEAALRATATRVDLSGVDEKWRALTDGVARFDYDARMQARQLVADTFEQITVYHHGVDHEETPKGAIDVMLLAKGGVERLLRVNARGEWVASEDVDREQPTGEPGADGPWPFGDQGAIAAGAGHAPSGAPKKRARAAVPA